MSFLTSGKVSQQVDIRAGAASASGTTINGAWIDASLAPQIAAVAQANVDVASVQWQEATAADGTGGQNLGTADTFAAGLAVSEIPSARVTTGFTHVRAVVTLSATGAGAVVYALGNSRKV